jgi:hypothetical protein
MMSKLHALVIRDATDGLSDVPKWSMVSQTEYMEDGRWVSGMMLLTSIEDVLDRAEEQGVPIIFESMLEAPAKERSEEECVACKQGQSFRDGESCMYCGLFASRERSE